MNLKNLDQAIVQISEKKRELFRNDLTENDLNLLKQEVDLLEQNFQYEYGALIEEALFNVHDEYCPDNEVLKPVAYLASRYQDQQGSIQFDVESTEGVPVEADDFPGIKARLVLVPGPARLVLQGQDSPFKEIVWRAPLSA